MSSALGVETAWPFASLAHDEDNASVATEASGRFGLARLRGWRLLPDRGPGYRHAQGRPAYRCVIGLRVNPGCDFIVESLTCLCDIEGYLCRTGENDLKMAEFGMRVTARFSRDIWTYLSTANPRTKAPYSNMAGVNFSALLLDLGLLLLEQDCV